jgi:hypothetical protein
MQEDGRPRRRFPQFLLQVSRRSDRSADPCPQSSGDAAQLGATARGALERVFLFGTRSADHIRLSGHSCCVVMGTCSHGCTRTLRGNVRFFLHRAPVHTGPERQIIAAQANVRFSRHSVSRWGGPSQKIEVAREHTEGANFLAEGTSMRAPIFC